MVTKLTSSLVFLRNNGSVLLGMKKRGFGMGKWNGFGGKIQNGESMLECAKRELLEECGIQGEVLEHVGALLFEFEDLLMHVHVYSCSTFSGEPRESEEMRPCWFKESELPYDRMWLDDQYWLPLLLKGAKFQGRFYFKDTETLQSFEVQEVDYLPPTKIIRTIKFININ